MMLLTSVTVRPPLHAKLFILPPLVYQVIHRDMKNIAPNRYLLPNVMLPVSAGTDKVVGCVATFQSKVHSLQPHEPGFSQELRHSDPLCHLYDRIGVDPLKVDRFQIERSDLR